MFYMMKTFVKYKYSLLGCIVHSSLLSLSGAGRFGLWLSIILRWRTNWSFKLQTKIKFVWNPFQEFKQLTKMNFPEKLQLVNTSLVWKSPWIISSVQSVKVRLTQVKTSHFKLLNRRNWSHDSNWKQHLTQFFLLLFYV